MTTAATSTTSGPRAPAHLSPEAKRFWRRVVRGYEVEAHHEMLLAAACEALDRMREAQAAVGDEPYVEGRFGLKAHPGLAIERDSRLALARLIREMGLDLESPATSKPPTRWK